jgi:hypothetical protein
MTVTATKIDNSHESGKNFITWAWLVLLINMLIMNDDN